MVRKSKGGDAAIGLYGLGRFGYFYSDLLSRLVPVKAASRNPSHPVPAGVAMVREEELFELPVLVLCVAISSMREVLQRFSPRLRPGMLVMDTCSVKSLPAAWMREILPPEVDILATHPMFGPDSGKGGVEGLPLILCPQRISKERFQRWHDRFASLGVKTLVMEPEEHDRQAALTQGLTHFLGRVLSRLDLKETEVSSLGYKRLLAIIEQTCNDTWQLFLDLQGFNPYTRRMRQALSAAMREVDEQLDSGAGSGD